MSFIIGVDFETTGLDPLKDSVIEIGAITWDTERKRPCLFYDALIKVPAPLPKIITEITGITDLYLDKFCISAENAFKNLNILIEHCSYIVAHNAPFDKSFYEQTCIQLGAPITKKPWIDTATDIPYSDDIQTRKLKHLAAEHAFLNPFSHRAIPDVLTMLTILSKYDMKEVIKYQSAKNIKIIAKVTFETKAEAQSRGYRWDAINKQWIKFIKEFLLDKEIKESPFEVKVL